MPRPVRNKLDQALWLPEMTKDTTHYVQVASFLASAYVKYFAQTALVQDAVNGAAMVPDIDPVPDVFAVSVNRYRSVVQCVCYGQRNQLLMVLVGPVIVGASGYGNW